MMPGTRAVRPACVVPGHAHLCVCVAPDGEVRVYPEPDADPELPARGPEMVVHMLAERPERIRCAAGACTEHKHDA